MQILEIEPTYTTPKVVFDPQKNFFHICGSSIPENVDEFYSPLLDWLEIYLKKGNPEKIEFSLKINYFNASSCKSLLRLMQKLKSYENKGGLIHINWFYCKNDPLVYEIGQDFSSMLQLDFKFIDHPECCHSQNNFPFSVN